MVHTLDHGSLIWLQMNTPDLAITEAAAGICMTVLMMIVVFRTNRRENSNDEKRIRNLLFWILIIMAVYGILAVVELLLTVCPTILSIMKFLSAILMMPEDTGVLNMVTSIVLDYRAYDTMFETIVLFTAALAVVITIKTSKVRRMVNERLYP